MVLAAARATHVTLGGDHTTPHPVGRSDPESGLTTSRKSPLPCNRAAPSASGRTSRAAATEPSSARCRLIAVLESPGLLPSTQTVFSSCYRDDGPANHHDSDYDSRDLRHRDE